MVVLDTRRGDLVGTVEYLQEAFQDSARLKGSRSWQEASRIASVVRALIAAEKVDDAMLIAPFLESHVAALPKFTSLRGAHWAANIAIAFLELGGNPRILDSLSEQVGAVVESTDSIVGPADALAFSTCLIVLNEIEFPKTKLQEASAKLQEYLKGASPINVISAGTEALNALQVPYPDTSRELTRYFENAVVRLEINGADSSKRADNAADLARCLTQLQRTGRGIDQGAVVRLTNWVSNKTAEDVGEVLEQFVLCVEAVILLGVDPHNIAEAIDLLELQIDLMPVTTCENGIESAEYYDLATLALLTSQKIRQQVGVIDATKPAIGKPEPKLVEVGIDAMPGSSDDTEKHPVDALVEQARLFVGDRPSPASHANAESSVEQVWTALQHAVDANFGDGDVLPTAAQIEELWAKLNELFQAAESLTKDQVKTLAAIVHLDRESEPYVGVLQHMVNHAAGFRKPGANSAQANRVAHH